MIGRRVCGCCVAVLMTVSVSSAEEFDGRDFTQKYWEAKGLSSVAAAGIAAQVAKESGGDPTAVGDGGTSLGLFQHHADRMKALLARIQNDHAFAEMMGQDPVAAAHFGEIKNAKTVQEASRLWQRFFERPKGTPITTARLKPVKTTNDVVEHKPQPRDHDARDLSALFARLSADSNIYSAPPIALR